jgi:hypothetical protein
MNPVESAELMAAVCDALLPGEGNYPRASVTGIQAVVANRLRERYGGVIFDNLTQDLAIEGRGFVALDENEQVAALKRLEAEKPEFFGYLLMAAYLAYYATPPVIDAIRLDGHIYNDAPQPLGYELKPFSFTPGVDLPLVPRGSFKWTFMVERIDISSLADLDLPTGRERA